jgi:hypothetical protein
MGLSVEVGYLADIRANDDEEAAGWFREQMDQLNGYLESVGLQRHDEPEECDVFSCDLHGYSGVHYLRRIAAHLDLRARLPPPGNKEASKDPVVAEYYRQADEPPPGLLSRLFRRSTRPRTFDHLMLHSDAEGYYLPQDFPSVLLPPESLEIAGEMVGSSVRLLKECKRLAAALRLPLELDPESDEVFAAMNSQGPGELQWQRYGIESYVCLQLHDACEHSLKNGAAIVFC